MNLVYFPLICASVLNVALGFIVFRTNSKRGVNQQFLALTIVLAGWLLCLRVAFTASGKGDLEVVEFWVRQASSVGVFVPLVFNLLRLSICHRNDSFLQTVARCRIWFFINFFLVILCQTDVFLERVVLPPSGEGLAEPEYGPAFPVFASYFMVALPFLIYRFLRDHHNSEGMQRVELQYVLLGCACCIFVGALFTIILPLLTKRSQLINFAPFNIFFMDGFIAYGIATRRIMDVAYMIRRAIAYGLLTGYLIVLYFGISSATALILGRVMGNPSVLSHLFASLVVAFSLAPAHGFMQRFADRLFINPQAMNVGDTVREINQILQSIRTVPDLLKRFSDAIAGAVGTDRTVILLYEEGRYVQKYPKVASDEIPPVLDHDAPLVQQLKSVHELVINNELERRRPTIPIKAMLAQMEQVTAEIAIGINSRRDLRGIMLLGRRLSGRIYGSIEQNVLKIFCDQLAVSLENAQLFTEAQDSNIYHEILLDNLVSGVVAVNNAGQVTVFNREAQRICHRCPADVVNGSFNRLPKTLAEVVEKILKGGHSLRDIELTVPHDNRDDVPIRLGGTNFHNHSGEMIGALAVFNDLSAIKKLEGQMRRTDRLVSIGTLSASMAHEIKNPLVAIKTFTQLLPERFNDEEFRDAFNSLVGSEVHRIDALVNQLLRFSRPAPPTLAQTNLHEVVEHSIQLIQHRLEQSNVCLHQDLAADYDLMSADANQLQQVFVNFFLNAVEAMPDGGDIFVSSELTDKDLFVPDPSRSAEEKTHMIITVRDTGPGIEADNLLHVFDPFFSTKAEGTGMGLAVAHGIIQEHGGRVDLESNVGEGTSFHVVFPLLRTAPTAGGEDANGAAAESVLAPNAK